MFDTKVQGEFVRVLVHFKPIAGALNSLLSYPLNAIVAVLYGSAKTIVFAIDTSEKPAVGET